MSILADPHSQWMAEHDRLYAAANAPGIDEAVSLELTGQLCLVDDKLIVTPASTMRANYLRCLALVKLLGDGQVIAEEHAREISAEADAFLAAQRIYQDAFDTALAEYRRVRTISDETPFGHTDEDARVDDYCDAMDALVQKARAPNVTALALKIELLQERYDGLCGWGEDNEEAIRLDLAHLERLS